MRFKTPRAVEAVALSLLLLLAGCAGTYSATVATDPYGPDLVYAAPGVQVIADYNEPIFYSDGLYWRYDGGGWYRSSYYTGGWVYASPPVAVLRIGRPTAYVHYRPQGWTPRPYRSPQPIVHPSQASRGWTGQPSGRAWSRPPAQAAPRAWSGQPAPQAAPRAAPSTTRGWSGQPPPSGRLWSPAPAQAAPHAAPPSGGWRSTQPRR